MLTKVERGPPAGPATGAEPWLLEFARREGCPTVPSLRPGDERSPVEMWNRVTAAWGITSQELTERIAAAFHCPVARLGSAEPRVQALVPESLARRCCVLPLRETDHGLVVATWDPGNMDVEQALGFVSARSPSFEVASPAELQTAIDAHYGADGPVERLLARVGVDLEAEVRVVAEREPASVATRELDSAPVVRLTSMIITEAVQMGASDIHLEPGRDGGLVRFRIDGLLRTYMQIPMLALNRVVSRIKVMGKLDIADRLRPQDGRTRVEVAGRTLDLRLSTVPTRDSEKAVIRLLDPTSTKTLDALAIPPVELERFRRLLKLRDGIVVVTGPTGSGKTTTLYAALLETVTPEVNVMTVEDPVEYELPGMTQIQVEPKRDVTFASALRSILRQDPNVIFVGEIRDRETAEIAVQAALTGHLVLATIHANDAAGSIARFVDLGLEGSKIAGTLRGALAQRLLRRLCPDCAVPVAGPLTPPELKLFQRYGVRPVMRAVGCPQCHQTGYRGRFPVMEVMLGGDWLEEMVKAGASSAEVNRGAQEHGMQPLREVALARVRAGDTNLEELERVLGATDAPAPKHEEPPRVLVVDDDPTERIIARRVLEAHGFRVTEAADGRAALDLLEGTEDYQLVVLDLRMPRLDGAEVLARVRRSVKTAGLPVLILTGTADEATEIALMEQGADDYVRKPIVPARFVARVRAALRRSSG